MAPWLIAVIVISVVVGLTLLALSIWWCVWMSRRNNRRQAEMFAQSHQAEMGYTNNAFQPATAQLGWGGGGQYPYPASNAPPPHCTRGVEMSGDDSSER